MTTGIFEIDDDFHREASPESEEEYEITDEVDINMNVFKSNHLNRWQNCSLDQDFTKFMPGCLIFQEQIF